MKTDHRTLVNPAIELAIIYSRSLLEFLGLKMRYRDRRLICDFKRRIDDVCVVWVRLGNLALRQLLSAIEASLSDVHRSLGTRSLRVVEIR